MMAVIPRIEYVRTYALMVRWFIDMVILLIFISSSSSVQFLNVLPLNELTKRRHWNIVCVEIVDLQEPQRPLKIPWIRATYDVAS